MGEVLANISKSAFTCLEMPCHNMFWPFIINHHNMYIFSFNWPIEKHACVHISLHSWYSFKITFTTRAWSYTSCSTVSIWFSGLAFLSSLLFTCFWPPVVPAFTRDCRSNRSHSKPAEELVLLSDLCCKQCHYMHSFQHLPYFSS